MSWSDEPLRSEPLAYRVWGQKHVDSESLKQMDAAMTLPVAVAGALMPDAHVGYGLPIGGVLATEGAVIPYAVGVDIACRMRLSIYRVSPIVLNQRPGQFKNALLEQTRFGAGGAWQRNARADHEVLDDPAWTATSFLRSLHNTAYGQLGTSGSGNHFVEWGAFRLREEDEALELDAGEYLALLTHSGSRGIGFKIANHYSKSAQEYHPKLDPRVRHLAWLPLDWEVGQEYWLSMELAGRFASANHYVIHQRVAKAVGLKPLAVVENHHNFAWKVRVPSPSGFADPEREVIVHRKGATPAEMGTLGIIPGSMGDAGYVVRGKGNLEALYSASHGAGRAMSRKKALESITKTERDKYLRKAGVTLIGGGLDESPQAYKPIDDIMAAQSDLVYIVGKFTPRMVVMDRDSGKHGGNEG
jgi:tRNA-splicing ligase RtcB (3'-phosphate/5'-hydroxy nucleic acid ligase)